MSWQEPVVQQYIQQESCNCIANAACGYGKDWHKTWMLASTFLALEQMACECPHPKGSHQQIAGTRSTDGHFFSRDTAQYPVSMADKFAALILPLLTTTGISTNLPQVSQYFPIQSLVDAPFPRQEGGGHSLPS